MPHRDASTVYSIGAYIQWLLDQERSLSLVKGESGVCQNLETLLTLLKEIAFSEKSVINDMGSWIKKLRRYRADQRIGKRHAKELSDAAVWWSREIEKFLENSTYYEILPNGVLDIDYLLRFPKDFFQKSTYWTKLSKIARGDFKEACKCLAFELPTASAFLVMRCVEDVLRRLYTIKTGRSISGFIDWGTITQQLRSHITADLADGLDYLRRNFRNPVSHPEAVYRQKEAETLLQTATRIVEKMISQMGS